MSSKFLRRLIALFIIAALFFQTNSTAPLGNPSFASLDDQIKARERDKAAMNELVKKIQKELNQKRIVKEEVHKKIYNMVKEIEGLQKEILNLQSAIKRTEEVIEEKEIELAAAIVELGKKRKKLNQRLRVMYKSGSVGYLEVLLGADSLHELLTRASTLQTIVSYDQSLITDLKEYQKLTQKKKESLEEEKDVLDALHEHKLKKQSVIQKKKDETVAYANQLEKEEKALEQEESKKLSETAEIDKLIKELKLSREKYVGGKMVWPVPGVYYISSPYGYRLHPITKQLHIHSGVDIAGDKGSKIVAAQTGIVKHADWRGGFGRTVMIDHGGGIVTLYAHLDSINVRVGQKVAAGEKIGGMGSTGVSTGSHLHFTVYENDKHVDPMKYLKK